MFGGVPMRLLCVLVGALSLSVPAIAQVQIDQQFISLGPAPSIGPLDTVGSGDLDGGNSGTVTGAVQAILAHEALGRDTMFVGATNGGIWRTVDGGNTWTPLTDNAHSLSIGSLDLDVTDPTGKTLIAGIGATSSGFWAPIDFGARPTGVLYSTDGGQSWEPLGLGDLGTQSVTGVAARGDTILAATFEPRSPTILTSSPSQPYGLYRSTNQGQDFHLVTDGLAPGPITSLVAAPDDPKTFYAAVTTFNETTQLWEQGVYKSTSDDVAHIGESWEKIFDIPPAEEQHILKLAAGKNGSIAVAVIENSGSKREPLEALYLSQGGEFSALRVPIPGPQSPPGTSQAEISDERPSGILHSALAIDPNDTSIVYWAGWEQPGPPTTVGVFRIQGDQLTVLTCAPTNRQEPPCSGSTGTAHADPRGFAFDADGNLLMVGDGGVYKRTNPQGNGNGRGAWFGFNTLTVHEPYQVGYGANARRLVVDAQDTGVGVQIAPAGTPYRSVQGADGHAAVVSDGTFANQSVYYTSSQTFSDFARLILDVDGNSPTGTTPLPGGVPITCNGGRDCSFATGIAGDESAEVTVALNAIQPKLIALTSGLNVYVAEDGAAIDATSVDLNLTDLGYGKAPRPPKASFRALAYGASDNPFELLAGGQGPHGLYRSTFAKPGDPATVPLTQILTYDGKEPTSLAFGPFSEAFYVADSNNLHSTQDDGANFTLEDLTGSGITNPTSVEFINNNGVQALLVGGLKSTAAAPSPVAVADSDAIGFLSDFRPFGQGMPNVLAYDISYNPIADVLAVGGVGRGVWTLFDVTSYFPQATSLQFGLAGNDSIPSAQFLTDGMSLDGTPFVRGLNKYAEGILTIAGDASYTGDTTILGGTLAVHGSITSKVIVNAGATLSGTGTIAALLNNGGVIAPGPAIGTLSVAGDAAFGPGVYQVEVNPHGNGDQMIVGGAVNLSGAILRVLAQNGDYSPSVQYVVIDKTSGGPVAGTFEQVTANSIFLTPTVAYDGGTGNDVVLTLNAVPFSSVATTPNQRAVATALDQGVFGALAQSIFFQTEEGAQQAFNALSGEIHATVAGTLADDSRYVREAMLGRMMQATYSDGAGEIASLAAAGPQVASLDGQAMTLGYDGKSLIAPEPLAFWTRAFGAWGDFDTDGNAASADRSLGGFVSGMDAQVSGSWRVGLATGASFSTVNVDARYSSSDIETYHLGGYIGGMAGAFALRGGGAWAWNDIDTSRAVVFPGFYERQKASYDADTGQLFGEVAYPTRMGGMALEPFAGLAYVSIDTEKFRERGGVLASLRGDTDQDVGYSTVGLRAARTVHWGTILVTPHISAAWQHAFDDVTPDAALAFASTGIGFSIAGVPLAEDSVLLDTGLDFAIGARTTAGVSYSGQFGDDVTDNAVKGRFTWLF